MNQRQPTLQTWLSKILGIDNIQLQRLTGDASFRRYFRLQHNNQSYIAVDASQDNNSCTPFVQIAKIFSDLNLHVPDIIESDLEYGFLLISDLGNDLYSKILNLNNADQLYNNAIDKLLIIQKCPKNIRETLKPFDSQFMRQELDQFTTWFLEKYLEFSLSPDIQKILEETYQILLKNGEEQLQVCIHRDYHSRNLIALPKNEVGILDFQDAMTGPITYDLVSLLRDCYIRWPNNKVQQWALKYYQKALAYHLISDTSENQFLKYFDLMGMQRHLKAIFIFARKFLRDSDESYLENIPRTLNYVVEICQKYPEFSNFQTLLMQKILPAFYKKSGFTI